MKYVHWTAMLWLLTFSAGTCLSPQAAAAASAAEIDQEVNRVLETLYAQSAAAREMGEKAKGILVFPGIVKGGFLVGGQFGEGALLKGAQTLGYYNTVQLSYGLQVGVQKYGYALFLMSDSARSWIDKSDGWEVGVGPSIVVLDTGAAKAMTTTTLQAEIYAFFFDQKGVMAGLGLQGTKITRINK
jgi:lipid-binding SYLF domain-containing protein